jgi:two-component system response regulator
VDDNEDHRFLTSQALRRGSPGVSVLVDGVADGTQTLDYLYRRGAHADRSRPDLVLLDLSLPGADGLEVLRTVKQDAGLAPIPVVILTSSDRPEDVRAAYAGGANSFVTKSRDLAPLVRYWTETVTLQDVW